MLFIDNEFYIAMITNRIIKYDDSNYKYVYEYDIDNLDSIEREKFLYYINKNIKKCNKYIKSHYLDYVNITKYYNNHRDIEIDYNFD